MDLEEYIKEKILEIITQIDKLKNSNKISSKYNKNRNINNSREKNSFNLYEEKLAKYRDNKKKSFKGLNSKNEENKNSNINFEKKNSFNSTGYNFHKSKLCNEQINHKIFNSSCKSINTCSNLNDLDNNFHTTKDKGFFKSNIITKSFINCVEKNDENKIIDNKELKKIKYRNNSAENLFLSSKKGESLSFNESDVKIVYLNKFVNDHLPYPPMDAFYQRKK